jgi:ribosomal protein RSM22 (predicted rRNA methylase)
LSLKQVDVDDAYAAVQQLLGSFFSAVLLQACHRWWEVLAKSVRAVDLAKAAAEGDTSLRVCLAQLPFDDDHLIPNIAAYLIAGCAHRRQCLLSITFGQAHTSLGLCCSCTAQCLCVVLVMALACASLLQV